MTHWRRAVHLVAILVNAFAVTFLVWQGAKDAIGETRDGASRSDVSETLRRYAVLAVFPVVSLIALGLRKP